MSIKKKLTLSLGLVVIGFCLVLQWVLHGSMMTSFESLEHSEANKDVNRVVQAIDSGVTHLDLMCGDWGVWDDAYRYVAGEDATFAEKNLYDGVLETIKVNLVVICDSEGKVVFQSRVVPEGLEDVDLIEFPAERVQAMPALLHTAQSSSSVKGLVDTAWGPMLVSSQPVMKNKHVGPTLGSFIMGRVLDPKMVEHFRQETHVDFVMRDVDAAGAAAEASGVEQAEPTNVVLQEKVDERLLRCSTVLRDISGRPVQRIEASIPRDITLEGRGAVFSALLSALGAAFVLLTVLYFLLQKIVIGPLTRFTVNVVKVGARAEVVKDLDLRRGDEIGALSNRFVEMLEQNELYQQRLSESAHKAGMSEVATNVLHNVGNMLNGVSVSSSVLSDRLRQMPVGDLAKVAGLVREKGPDLGRWVSEDPAGRRLPELLERMATRLSECKSTTVEECTALSSRVVQVVSLIQAQQDLAGGGGHVERIVLPELVEAALRVTSPEEEGIDVQRAIEDMPPLMGDRHKLMQILVNLIKNATEACTGPARADKCIRITARRDGSRVRIEIADNGCGIKPELLSRIFQHGFTTKPNGHGFGLHSVANAIKEMKGTLHAESGGEGQGATLSLELPMDASAVATRAESSEPQSLLRHTPSSPPQARHTVPSGSAGTAGPA